MSEKNFRRDLERTSSRYKKNVEICAYYIAFDRNKTRVSKELGIDRETVTRAVSRHLIEDVETGELSFRMD